MHAHSHVGTLAPAPTAEDMAAAKLLYVQLKLDYSKNPEVKNLDDFKMLLGEKGATAYWTGMEGLRHKYFIYDRETETCSGIYVFFDQAALDKYMASDLFKSHKTPEIMPHFNGQVTATVLDVMPGTRTRTCTHTPKHAPKHAHAHAHVRAHACTHARASSHTHDSMHICLSRSGTELSIAITT